MRGWWDRWGEIVVALVLTSWGQVDFWTTLPADFSARGGPLPVAVLLALVTLSPAGRRRAPSLAILAAGLGFAVPSMLVLVRLEQEPVAVFLGVILAFYSAGVFAAGPRALAATVVAIAVIIGLDVWFGVFEPEGDPAALGWLILAVAWFIGREIRRRRQDVERLSDRTRSLERQRQDDADRAVLEERTRIARELHDVIAHGVSVMIVQAQAGPRLLGHDDRVREVFGSIERAGKEALAEMRHLLGILRTPDDTTDIAPQPGLSLLPGLVDQVRHVGLTVDVHEEGEPVPLPSGIDLCAYRIVQEALTNTIKHGHGTHATVLVRYTSGSVELEVIDDGNAPAPSRTSGHGLIGMRERAELFGGTFRAGPLDGAGYAVRARFPVSGRGGMTS